MQSTSSSAPKWEAYRHQARAFKTLWGHSLKPLSSNLFEYLTSLLVAKISFDLRQIKELQVEMLQMREHCREQKKVIVARQQELHQLIESASNLDREYLRQKAAFDVIARRRRCETVVLGDYAIEVGCRAGWPRRFGASVATRIAEQLAVDKQHTLNNICGIIRFTT